MIYLRSTCHVQSGWQRSLIWSWVQIKKWTVSKWALKRNVYSPGPESPPRTHTHTNTSVIHFWTVHILMFGKTTHRMKCEDRWKSVSVKVSYKLVESHVWGKKNQNPEKEHIHQLKDRVVAVSAIWQNKNKNLISSPSLTLTENILKKDPLPSLCLSECCYSAT